MSLPNGNQTSSTSTLRMCTAEERLVGRADMRGGGKARDQHQRGDEPAEVIVEVRQHAQHRMRHAPKQHREEQASSVSTEITVITLLGKPGQVKPNRLPRNTMCGPNSSTTMNRPM